MPTVFLIEIEARGEPTLDAIVDALLKLERAAEDRSPPLAFKWRTLEVLPGREKERGP
jgi:hypothetical protein